MAKSLSRARTPKKTFDSSRAPKRGEKRTSRKLKPLDVGRLKERLAVVEAEVAASNPAKLKAEIATLQAEKAKLEKQVTAAAGAKKPPDKDALNAAEQKGFDQAKRKLAKAAEKTARETLKKFFAELREKLKPLDAFLAAQESEARRATLIADEVTFQPTAAAVVPRTATVASNTKDANEKFALALSKRGPSLLAPPRKTEPSGDGSLTNRFRVANKKTRPRGQAGACKPVDILG